MNADIVSGVPANRTSTVTVRSPGTVLSVLLACIVILLPLITLDTNPESGSPDLISRLQPVDVLTLLWIVAYLPQKTLRIHQAGALYILSLVVAVSLGVARSDASELSTVLVAFLALSMAFVYWVLGYNIGRSRSLTTLFFAGLIIGICWEAIIVFHDYFSSALWFVDEYPGRVRGTFHKSGQLAAFGFSSAGILLSMGWAISSRRWWRGMTILAALLGIFFIWAAARRSGLIAFAVWGLFILLMIVKLNLKNRFFFSLLILMLFTVPLVVSSINISSTLTGKELAYGFGDIQQGNTFAEIQFHAFMSHSENWFPFGLGTGRAQLLDVKADVVENEIHNGHLALLVEIGVLGLLSFYWMAMLPIVRQWNGALGSETAVVRILVITFIAAAAIFALHNRLHRDRVFMLFLGLATALHQTSDKERNVQR